MDIPSVSVRELHTRLGFQEPLDYPETSLNKPLTDWKMEVDDSPIFRYLYRNFQPLRHLEFGTWQGTGVIYCLEECEATVWTINLLQGEELPNGSWAYSNNILVSNKDEIGNPVFPSWSRGKWTGNSYGYQTDSFGFIGKYYLERDLGYRVCQIYCDSREWDISGYPEGFFDTVLIDGGHSEEIVANDIQKACQLIRSGGLMMWHDFCPDPEVLKNCAAPRGVLAAIKTNWDWIQAQMTDIFWVEPSWILVGVKKNRESIKLPSSVDLDIELKRAQAELQHARVQLERSQTQLQRTQSELQQTQSALQQTQGELQQTQSELQQTQGELQQTQGKLQQTQSELQQTQGELQQTQGELQQTQSELQQAYTQLHSAHLELQQVHAQLGQSHAQLQQTQTELTHVYSTITDMESTQFWKLRMQWLRLKQLIGLTKGDSKQKKEL